MESDETHLTLDQKYQLITRNLQEVLGKEKLISILKERDLKIYWGTATTGKPHIAYFVPMTKIADFLDAGCEVTILFADLHAYLDNMKAPWELLKLRTEYYEEAIKAMLKSIGVSLNKLRFIRGTDIQLSREYTLDVYRLVSLVTVHDAKKAGAEVVKQTDNPVLGGLMYPGLQALDEEHLGVDAQFGGNDQRKIFTFAEKYLPALNYEKRIHLMNPMVPGLQATPPPSATDQVDQINEKMENLLPTTIDLSSTTKMSASIPDSKIDLLDSPSEIRRKIKKAFCAPGNVSFNGPLNFIKYVIFPSKLARNNESFLLERTPENGGDVTFETYEELEREFENGLVHPGDLKAALTRELVTLLKPIQDLFSSAEMKRLVTSAYPPEDKKAATLELLDLRVGQLHTVRHLSATDETDNRYVGEILFGPNENPESPPPRSSIIGLKNLIPCESLEGTLGVFLCNIKARTIGGIKSNAMLLCAKKEMDDKYEKKSSHNNDMTMPNGDNDVDSNIVEILRPPLGSKPGDRVYFQGHKLSDEGANLQQLKPKKRIWENIQIDLRTNERREIVWKGSTVLTTANGPIRCNSIVNGMIV